MMQNMDDRKGETWELAMETLKDLGRKLKVAISDAGSGLLKGVKAAFPIRYSWSYKLSSEILRFRERLPTIMLFIGRLFRDFSMKAEAMGLPEEVFRLLYSRFAVSKESEAYAKLIQQASALIPAGELANVEKVHDEIVTGIKRASSMVENVNGRLRAYMNIKRHVSSNFYSLVQLHMNAKKYRRSRVASRKGHSPLELLTGIH
ncbi:hypothetical protein [Selenomonas sp. AB3002]|uniref:hypothetical protein n=1 Tax=Selenomonas sp. AB3002 TaxID=1392502 RepID=UPI000ACB82EF